VTQARAGPRYVLAIANHKGGVGKSTVAVNLAAALAERGERVLVVDTDAQGTATAWLRGAPSDGLARVFRDGADLVAEASSVAGVALVASPADLRESALPLTAFAMLRRALGRLRGPWSRVLIDTPPHYGLVSLAALVASDGVLVPTEASVMTLRGLASVTRAVEEAAGAVESDPRPALVGVVVNRADLRQVNARQAVAAVRDAYGSLAWHTVVRDTVRLRDAAALAVPITELDPNSGGAEDFRALAAELERRIGDGRQGEGSRRRGAEHPGGRHGSQGRHGRTGH
jgi:chromosome partitioning protein